MAQKIDPDIERLAERLACLCVKEISGKTQKWDKMAPADRSLWRLLARAAIEEMGMRRPSGPKGRSPSGVPSTFPFLPRR